jgi:hypothetical protein
LRRRERPVFPEPLARFIETDREGNHSFSYPAQCGHLKAVLDHLAELLQAAAAAPARRQRAEIKAALDYVTQELRSEADIHQAWKPLFGAAPR